MSDAPDAAAAPDPSEGPAPKRRRRGSRGGRNRNRSRAAQAVAVDADRLPDDLPDRPIEGVPSPEAAEKATVRPFLTPKVPPPQPAAAEAAPADEEAPKAGGRKRRRRGGRGRGKKPELLVAPEDESPLDEETLERRRGRERKGRPVGRYQMCVHLRPGATQIAVLEGRSLIEHYVSRPQDEVNQIDGNIYIGKVQNVLPGMEAAFVDIGTPKNAVLYRGDVHYDKEDVEGGPTKADFKIEQVLRAGQTVLCQVTKN